ncbi:MAG: hypothetical protein ABI442_10835 [Gemmatimonadaceae bacterium]
MIDTTGIFRTTIAVAALNDHNRFELADVVVDTASEYNWIPEEVIAEIGITPVRVDRFETADGRILERRIGVALLYAGGWSTATVVAFAEAGDMALLAAIGLEGLNVQIDLGRKELIPAGPDPVAAAVAA